MVAVWHWLITQGLYRDVLATVIGLTGARLIAWRPLKKNKQLQEKIADRLDTSTPGGLGAVHRELQDVKLKLAERDGT